MSKINKDDKVVGHKTFRNKDGSYRHEPLTQKEAQEMLARCDELASIRKEKMPDEQSALAQLMEAYIRLKELGWCEAIYCPKDGSSFLIIEAGSTGIHECCYLGEWPKGTWMISDGYDFYPSRPILWKKK